MTISKQESTFAGGLEIKQIPQQIEIGVYKHLVSLELSHSQATLSVTIQLRISTSHPPQTGTYNYPMFYHDPVTSLQKRTPEFSYYFDFYRYYHLGHVALKRYLEIWGPMNRERFIRALKGKQPLFKSFPGLAGMQNSKHTGALEKLPSGFWALKDLSKLYPEVKELPPKGRETARRVARELAAQAAVKQPV